MYLSIGDSWQNVRKTSLHSKYSERDGHQTATVLLSLLVVCYGTLDYNYYSFPKLMYSRSSGTNCKPGSISSSICSTAA